MGFSGIADPLADGSIVWRSRQAFLVFCVCVANKRGDQTLAKVSSMLAGCVSEYEFNPGCPTPFQWLRHVMGLHRENRTFLTFEHFLREHRVGQYARIERALREIIVVRCIDPEHTNVEELESVPGIGSKTARYFMMRAHGARVATLDTHVLKWLALRGVDGVPRQTPHGKEYARLEQEFLRMADERGLTPDALDGMIWRHYAQGAPAVD